MDSPSREDLRYSLLQHLGAIYWRASGGHASDQDFCAVRLQYFLDPPPVIDLQRRDRRSNCHAIEAEQAMAEDNWIPWTAVYNIHQHIVISS